MAWHGSVMASTQDPSLAPATTERSIFRHRRATASGSVGLSNVAVTAREHMTRGVFMTTMSTIRSALGTKVDQAAKLLADGYLFQERLPH